MRKINAPPVCVALAAILFAVGGAHAVSSAEKCEASKLGAAGKYHLCRLKAAAKAVKSGGAPDFGKCDLTFSGKWAQAESTASGMCPSTGDEAPVRAFITEHTSALEAALHGGPLLQAVQTCNANLAACIAGQSALPKTGQMTVYGTGSDGDRQDGAPRSYTDNGDGTITDNTTGLMWEKKDQSGGIHDFNNTYSWNVPSVPPYTTMSGTMVTVFLAALNSGGGFAGHTDWRIPNLNELQSIADYENTDPAVDPVFNSNCAASCTATACSCTQSSFYWTSTTYQPGPTNAWYVYFHDGFLGGSIKSNYRYVRAVRRGP